MALQSSSERRSSSNAPVELRKFRDSPPRPPILHMSPSDQLNAARSLTSLAQTIQAPLVQALGRLERLDTSRLQLKKVFKMLRASEQQLGRSRPFGGTRRALSAWCCVHPCAPERLVPRTAAHRRSRARKSC